MEQSTFGRRLGRIMEKKGIGRAALKDLTGISLQSISNYLNDKRKPDCEMVAELAKALNVSADYLLGLSEVATRNEKIRGIHEKTGLSEEAVSSLVVDRYVEDCEVADFVSFLIVNDDFRKLTKEIAKLSVFHHTTIDATLDVGGNLYDIDFEATFKLIVTDMFWEIARGYNNPFKLLDVHHSITT